VKNLIKLVKTYRVTAGLADRLRLAEEIFRLIQPDLWHFVLASIQPPAAEDVFQEVQKAVATGMRNFAGSTEPEFWAWCYRIARNKLNDHYRVKAADRMQPTAPEDLWQMMDLSAQDAPMTAQTRHDLAYAINLLTKSKPECSDLL
jgi:DNA-directed RNA polymerase specialized sigma24 family protein